MKQIQAPSLSDFPEYCEAREKLNSLGRERAALERERVELAEKFQKAREGSTVTARAKALLTGRGGEDPVAIGRRLSEIADRQPVLERAEALARQDLDKIRRKVSREICSTLAPRHRELARNVVTATLALGKALDMERDFRLGLERVGIEVSLPIARPYELGRADDPTCSSLLANLLVRACRAGIVALEEIPKCLHPIIKPHPLPAPSPQRLAPRNLRPPRLEAAEQVLLR